MNLPRIILLLVLLCTGGTAASAADIASADGELAFLAGYGITHPGFGATRTEVQTLDAILRYGHFLSPEVGRGAWWQGRHELLLELPLHLAVNRDNRVMTGGYLLGSWKFTGLADEKLLPYLFAGGGVLFVDLGLPTMGSRLDFSYQGGVGVQYLLKKGLAVMGEYRYHHVSNAGTAEPNEPLNGSKFLFGLTKFY
ncbi:MAG: acyloxyacyl hydrolase [Geobacter sp.]|nr:acyloxyacyl hydrolase [Geobacter sp.]